MTGSNRRPPACKAGALPAELNPHFSTLVGLVGLEPTTPALSTQCSNQLSYRPQYFRIRDSGFRNQIRCRTRRVNTTESRILNPESCIFRTTDECRHSAFGFSRKEVIQPHLPIRLPCYDFTPVMKPSVVSAPLAVRLPTSARFHSHGVTGGVYKTRERIHRDMLIRDY